MSKKSFKDNISPATQFITAPENNEQKSGIDTNILGQVPMKKNPIYIETKSKRLQLLMQPSLHLKLKNMATKQAVSVNELTHSILDEYFAKKEQ